MKTFSLICFQNWIYKLYIQQSKMSQGPNPIAQLNLLLSSLTILLLDFTLHIPFYVLNMYLWIFFWLIKPPLPLPFPQFDQLKVILACWLACLGSLFNIECDTAGKCDVLVWHRCVTRDTMSWQPPSRSPWHLTPSLNTGINIRHRGEVSCTHITRGPSDWNLGHQSGIILALILVLCSLLLSNWNKVWVFPLFRNIFGGFDRKTVSSRGPSCPNT